MILLLLNSYFIWGLFSRWLKTMVEICEVFGNHIASHWDKFYFVFEKLNSNKHSVIGKSLKNVLKVEFIDVCSILI